MRATVTSRPAASRNEVVSRSDRARLALTARLPAAFSRTRTLRWPDVEIVRVSRPYVTACAARALAPARVSLHVAEPGVTNSCVNRQSTCWANSVMKVL